MFLSKKKPVAAWIGWLGDLWVAGARRSGFCGQDLGGAENFTLRWFTTLSSQGDVWSKLQQTWEFLKQKLTCHVWFLFWQKKHNLLDIDHCDRKNRHGHRQLFLGEGGHHGGGHHEGSCFLTRKKSDVFRGNIWKRIVMEHLYLFCFRWHWDKHSWCWSTVQLYILEKNTFLFLSFFTGAVGGPSRASETAGRGRGVRWPPNSCRRGMCCGFDSCYDLAGRKWRDTVVEKHWKAKNCCIPNLQWFDFRRLIFFFSGELVRLVCLSQVFLPMIGGNFLDNWLLRDDWMTDSGEQPRGGEMVAGFIFLWAPKISMEHDRKHPFNLGNFETYPFDLILTWD